MARAKKGTEAEVGEMNKRQMVEAAMDAQGGNPGPKDIQEYVKAHHGVDLPYAMAASYKSQINKRRGLGGNSGGGRRGGGASGSVDLKDVAAVKALLDRLGAAQLNDLIKLLGR